MKTFAGRKLGRPTAARLALLRSLTASLLQHEKIQTTVPRAKELKRFAEQVITLAKNPSAMNAQRSVARVIAQEEVRKKLFEVLVPRYQAREGGYTQLFRSGPRAGDGAPMAVVRLVP